MKKFGLVVYVLFVLTSSNYAQSTVTLNTCYSLAETHYPFVAQKNILAQITDEAIQKINAVWQPQVYINAQATYQSDVTSIGITIPGIEIQELSKDQYKATLDISQTLYDGGISKQQRAIQTINTDVETQKVNVDMYKIRERINQIYLVILQAEKQLALVDNLKIELNNQAEKIKAGQQFGTATQFQADILAAEIIKADQKRIEIISAREAAINMLNQITGSEFNYQTQFETPVIGLPENDTIIQRPELALYDAQSKLLQSQMSFAEAATLPKLSLFVQGGYGRPGLNFLDDTFQFYYLGGIKLNYPLWTGNSKSHDAAIYRLQADNIENYKSSFTLTTSVQSEQQLAEIKKVNQLIEKDEELITLKTKIKTGAQAQLDNGTMAADDYVKYVTDENEAKINLAIHQMQLVAAQINYLTIIGKL
ncbi:MAG TPA: TolC family protein [Chitinophagales bacterium]|nr:TolC family protein [Chitinophagales bacterium]